MPIVINRDHKRKRGYYIVEGSGIYDSIIKPLLSSITSSATKELAHEFSKQAAKELGKVAVKKIVGKMNEPSQSLTPQAQMIKDEYLGSAIAIQDLVKKINTGSGLKIIPYK